LIEGESGTGKELAAHAIHNLSRRNKAKFVTVHCAALSPQLLESELFGYERGAFTGATEQRPGKFEQAAGGTLLLDEIGDMPLELQTKLLRVLQEREVTRLGGSEVIPVTCRVLAATNQPLDRAVQQGKFREDLYFRLNVVPIRVPPLRDRRGDIQDLVDFFLDKIQAEMGTRVTGISEEARKRLTAHDWPGNVRELENTLIRSAVLASGATLMPHDLVLSSGHAGPTPRADGSLEDLIRQKLVALIEHPSPANDGNLYAAVLEQLERPLIELTLDKTGGNQLQAAALLGINRNTLRKKVSALGVAPRRGANNHDD
jgi:two-component system nitrogen regulation response regulator GlnG